MNSVAGLIALVVFNVLLLILAIVAWRLLKSKPNVIDLRDDGQNEQAMQSKSDDTSVDGVSGLDAVSNDAASKGVLPEAGSPDTSTDLEVPPALRGPARLRDPERLVGAGRADAQPRRFVPGGVPISDGTVPDFTLAMSHLFTSDNGVLNRTRESSAQPITLAIQAGPRPVTPLLQRVVAALTNIGLEPTQTRPLVHSFSDAAGRAARVRLAHSPAHGDLIEIEIEPSISPAAMASVMALLSDLEFEPADTTFDTPIQQF